MVEREKPAQEIQMMLPQATMSSKSSQAAIVAQTTSSRTSLSGYRTRHEKCCKSRARRARGTSPSKIVSMMALHAN